MGKKKMFLRLLKECKKHLIGQSWSVCGLDEVRQSVWLWLLALQLENVGKRAERMAQSHSLHTTTLLSHSYYAVCMQSSVHLYTGWSKPVLLYYAFFFSVKHRKIFKSIVFGFFITLNAIVILNTLLDLNSL